MQSLIEDMFDRLLARLCSPKQVRAAELDPGDAGLANLWQEIEATGLPNALLGESNGGIGLSLTEVLPLFRKMGEYALPLPLDETTIARALLQGAGENPPLAPIILATAISQRGEESIETGDLPYARTAGFALVESGDFLHLVALFPSTLSPRRDPHSLSACISADSRNIRCSIPAAPVPLRETAALLHAAKLSGAMRQILAMTVDYAKTRMQFGRPIGNFQAVQQQISVMAQHVAAAAMAVDLAGTTGKLLPDPLAASVAKECASSAAKVVGAIAHAVHGAIGVSSEHDLQLYTRRLCDWRLAEGSESFWAQRVGQGLLESAETRSSDFVRNRLAM